jgi:hypothetical protein
VVALVQQIHRKGGIGSTAMKQVPGEVDVRGQTRRDVLEGDAEW